MSARQQIAEQSETFARGLLKERLALCTEEQKAFFIRFSGELDNIPIVDLPGAIDLCNRTIQKNEKAAT